MSWKPDVFTRARLKLTALYVIAIIVVTVVFSVTLYLNLTNDLKESVDGNLKENVDQESFIEDRSRGILSTLLLIDGGIIVLSGAAGYLFAGFTLRPIRSAVEAQERFTADAAHDLRTPLAVIRTQAEVLLRGKEALPEKAVRTLESILDETKDLSGITEDLLILARRDDATAPMPGTARASLDGTARDVAERIGQLARDKGVGIRLVGIPSCRVRMDDGDLKRVLSNVMDNAVRYSPEGGVVTVDATAEEPGLVTIRVADRGPGIPEKDLPHVFDRFYKADGARHSGGNGLGLSIVKQLVEAQGGSVTIANVPDGGTTVAIRLVTEKP